MSGLEVLGALASAIQLAETCLKITVFATDLFTRVRGAPEMIRKRVAEIEQLVEIARLIEDNLTLHTPLIASVLVTCHGDADQLLDILKKTDIQPTTGKVAKYWKSLKGVTQEKRILAICGRLQEKKSSLTLCIASVNSDLLREVDLQLVTVRQGVNDIVKELPAIRDTARKVTTIFDELPSTAAKVSSLRDDLPAISGKITAIHDDMPAVANKVTVIYDELPAIRDALERLALCQQAHIIEPASALSSQSQSVLPFEKDRDFVGREDIIRKIDQVFSDSRSVRRVALEGLGGVGKSQIAIEYAYRIWEKSPETRIFWVHAGNAARFEQSYRSIANVAKLRGAEEPKADILGMVFRWLENGIDGDWLMILDNANDAGVFFPHHTAASISQPNHQTGYAAALSVYLPKKSRGSILTTSRNRDAALLLTGKLDHVFKIDKLEEDDARKLLKKKLPEDHSTEADWNALIDVLERLPLAITQAAAYIKMRSPRMSISRYLEYFRRNEGNQVSLLSKDGGDLRRDPEVPNAVVLTWQISFNQIKLQNAPAAALLSRMSVLDRQGIPRFLLLHDDDDDDDLEFEDSIGTLIGFSFVSSQEDGNIFEMHPLVQLSTRKWLEVNGEIEQKKEEALNLLSQIFPNGEYDNWKICEALEPHAQVIFRYKYVSRHCRLERAKILHNSAWFAQERGNWDTGMNRIKEAVDIREELLSPDDPAVLDSRNLLALTLWSQGRWKEAEELEMQAMETRKRILGAEHPHTLTSMANLASTFRNQGRWKEAEELEMQVIETRKRVLGAEHLHTLTSMANLASTFRNQGRWKEAEELEMQVMETRKRILGAEHPHTLISIANLASTFRNQGRWKEAEELQKHELEICSRVLGQDHPETLTSMANLASTFRGQGRWEEAEELQKHELEICSRVLGQDHPDTLISMNNLATIWKCQDRNEDAVRLMTECIQLQTKIIGLEHPYTQLSISLLSKWGMDKSVSIPQSLS